MKPDFSKITYQKSTEQQQSTQTTDNWLTAEQIEVKPSYSYQDIANLRHVNFGAGLAPNLRGPYSTMYVMQPWTIRQYAGFSTAEESNAFYRRNLAAGQEGASMQELFLDTTGDLD